MKFLNQFFIALGVMSLTFAACAQKQEKEMDSLSYGVGILVGSNLAQQGLEEIDINDLAIGLSDVINGDDLRMTLEEANEVLTAYMQAQQSKQMAGAIEEGQAFLKQNAEREEVVVLESGLQYEILKAGDGPKPGLNDKVTTHYHGTLIDGTVFDSSVDRGQPASFPVSGVIKGWTEALQLMPVGSKWRLYVPYDLAYGERGAGAQIKPYSTLIFEVELLSID